MSLWRELRGARVVRVGVRFAAGGEVHELALIEGVVDEVLARVGDQRVAVVRLEIGRLAGVAVDALRFGFDVCTAGTPLHGATLDVIEIPGRGRCRRCRSLHAVASYAAPCPCGSFDRELVAGDELRIKEVEVT